MLVLTGCEKSGLLDYRNRFTGLYSCTTVEAVTHPTMNGADTTETFLKREVIQVEKVIDTRDELFVLGTRIKINKDGKGTTNVNTGASYVHDTYTVDFSEQTVTITRQKNGVNFGINATYVGVKI